MSKQFEKLVTLLKELFQLDQPDLDFGFYRVMHARSAEVTQFLVQDLLPQAKAAFAQYQPADKAVIEKELAKAIEQAHALGADPEALPKVKELRTRLADDAVDVEALEAEVFDHLYAFFRRYYSEGDFLSKRVYKPGVYSIPYEGEEVKLHWANSDQFYIKTSEYMRDYAFCLRPDDEKNPMRVHFRLIHAAEGEHGNLKEQAGKERRFKLAPAPFAAVENGELEIRFHYQPDPSKPKDLNSAAEASILGLGEPTLADWIRALRAPAPTDKEPHRTILAKHLKRYSDINTFDYFIHKDLGGFLRRELNFYIKNEVMHLDDVEGATAPRVEQYLSKIKVIRRIAGKIIAFLAQLEDFQKKLWLKKKFVAETTYCIRLGVIPAEFLPEIAANVAQREEWVRLYAIDEIKGDLTTPGYALPLTETFLNAHPTLVVDTRHFDADFVARLVEAIGDMGVQTDGLLIHSENFQALNLLEPRFSGALDAIYADPPYNTDASPIAYKNDYKSSSWLTLVENRMSRALRLLTRTGVACFAIDDEEVAGARFILGMIFPKEIGVAAVRANPQSRKTKGKFSPVHEYALFFGRSPDAGPGTLEITEARQKRYPLRDEKGSYAWMNMIRTGSNDRREDRPKLYYPIYVDDTNRLRIPDMTWDDEKGEYVLNDRPKEKDTIVFPVSEKNGQRIEKNWHRGPETVASDLSEYRVRRDDTGSVNIDFKTRMDEEAPPTTWWEQKEYASANYGAAELKALFGDKPFDYPKAVRLVEDCLRACNLGETSGILDPFAGSGTTGHAAVNLNRSDCGQRKFILVEQGDYFDTVLVPRLKKVTYTPEWKDGKPKRLAAAEEAERGPRVMKIVRLESYEDTLNNLEQRRTQEQQGVLDLAQAQGADKLKEQYMLRYMLDVETRGSQSLLNVQAFTDPTAYKLRVKPPGSDESREVNVDLLETFSWLIGLTVRHIAAPQSFIAAFERDSEKRLRLKGRLKQEAGGPYWFRTVTGTTPDGRKTLVIWRKLTGEAEQDNLVLDEWFTKQGYSAKDSEFDLIYVNGGNNLENLKTPDDLWKVRLIEEDFHRLMFEMEEG